MARKSKGKSFIPPKAQVPIAIAGGLLLVLIVVVQVNSVLKERRSNANPAATQTKEAAEKPKQKSKSTPPAKKTDPKAEPKIAETKTEPASATEPPKAEAKKDELNLTLLLQELEPVESALLATREQIATIEIDSETETRTQPEFARDPFAVPQQYAELELPNPLPEAPEDRVTPQTGELRLQGTCIMDDGRLAIVNDEVVRKGDSIGGYTVESIQSRTLTLSDGTSILVIEMEGIPEL